MTIFVRIKHRFGPRMTEWVLALHTALWGAVLLLPAKTFDGLAFQGFQRIFGSEEFLGAVMLFLGALRIGGLIVNGARKTVTPWIRVGSAAAGFLLFIGISVGYAASGVISTWLAVYPVFALVELVNIYRAAHDAGEGHGTT
jgi:hypothetical protein